MMNGWVTEYGSEKSVIILHIYLFNIAKLHFNKWKWGKLPVLFKFQKMVDGWVSESGSSDPELNYATGSNILIIHHYIIQYLLYNQYIILYY